MGRFAMKCALMKVLSPIRYVSLEALEASDIPARARMKAKDLYRVILWCFHRGNPVGIATLEAAFQSIVLCEENIERYDLDVLLKDNVRTARARAKHKAKIASGVPMRDQPSKVVAVSLASAP